MPSCRRDIGFLSRELVQFYLYNSRLMRLDVVDFHFTRVIRLRHDPQGKRAICPTPGLKP